MKRLLLFLVLGASLQGTSQNCLTTYTDSTFLKAIYFSFNGNSYSHWIQPWRSYLETVPASRYLNGVGVNMNGVAGHYDHYLRMLATHGIRHVRIEIPWAAIDYNSGGIAPSRLQGYTELLQACARWKVRPLILLNAHHGVPNPENYVSDLVLAAPAPAGSTQITVTNAAGIIPGKTGVCDITEYWAAQSLITAVNGNVLTVSQWPVFMPAGTGLRTFTLKYRPFARYGTPEYNETMNGWLSYVDTVVAFVSRTLSFDDNEDKEFDIEVWNELAFGSRFLNINNYYNPPYDAGINDAIRTDIVYQTAAYADARPEKFRGIRIVDGIANTLPWPASSTSHPRLDGIGKHPYGGFKTYPANNPGYTALNNNMQPASFSPVYSGVMPEYFLLGLQVEHIVRDMAPFSTKIYNTVHGRNARVVNGQVSPVPLYITENGITPEDFSITDPVAGQQLKNKTNSRLYSVYLNKGAEVVDIFCAVDGDSRFGMIQDNFVQYLNSNNSYPPNDEAYTSPLLKTLKYTTTVMEAGLDENLLQTRPVTLDSICDEHNNAQFQGNGTSGHPNLSNRDVLAFLPYQVNNSRFVIHYYIMTRDVLKDLPAEEYTLSVTGIKGEGAVVTAHDPVTGGSIPVTVLAAGENTLQVKVAATDYPRLLVVEEDPSGITVSRTSQGKLTAFPNPFTNSTLVEYHLQELPLSYTITDLTGKTIIKRLLNETDRNGKLRIDLTDFPPGLYVLQIESSGGRQAIKLQRTQ